MKSFLSKKRKIIYVLIILVICKLLLTSYRPLFTDPYSTVLNDCHGKLMTARIADDGQWRFPLKDTLPDKFKKSLLFFEDQYFYSHIGINPISIVKALYQNIKAGRIVRGGSTITLQLARMSRKGKSRTLYEKLYECLLALRYEYNFSKDEILKIYASHAPYGGNVVGIEAASWRYFGRTSNRLSWAESAMLAVLPNAPSLIYPGKNQKKLLVKRNCLLDKLYRKNIIDSMSCLLAKCEPLPQKPLSLPMVTPHLIDRAIKEGHKGTILNTTIDYNLQYQTSRIVNKHNRRLYQNDIKNIAAIVLDVESGNVLSYIGNTVKYGVNDGNYVDVISAPRSSGSILKPFLYALMQRDGYILPNSLLADIPTRIAGYKPQNFNRTFDGAVHASNALARSLNIPAVRMLRKYSSEKFLFELNKLNFSTINKSSDHYGLSLILGGAEVTLWDVVTAYAGMARELNEYENDNYNSKPLYYFNSSYFDKCITKRKNKRSGELFTEAAIWHTFEALSDMNRPVEGVSWNMYKSSRKIAWKTGTSYGHRDAWTVGVTPKYVVGVWVGNASGEGRAGLTGASTAAPIMFDIFKKLPQTKWFTAPTEEMIVMDVCSRSGYKASSFCSTVTKEHVCRAAERSKMCPYHKNIFLDNKEKYRVNSKCYNVSMMKRKSWFVLPPVMEWFYRSKDPFYRVLPPLHSDCYSSLDENIGLIYPENGATIFIPRGFNNIKEKVVFEAFHRSHKAKIFWHLDDEFLGETIGIHQMEAQPETGVHKLVLIDNKGEEISRFFTVNE